MGLFWGLLLGGGGGGGWGRGWGKRDRIDEAHHLIFNVHNLFDLSLVKKNCKLWRQKASRALRL